MTSPLATLHDEQQTIGSLIGLMQQEQQFLVSADSDGLDQITPQNPPWCSRPPPWPAAAISHWAASASPPAKRAWPPGWPKRAPRRKPSGPTCSTAPAPPRNSTASTAC